MGSFNIKCNLTDFSITYGEKMILFPIIQNSSYNKIKVQNKEEIKELWGFAKATCYHTAYWQTYNLPLFGTYDDYGNMKLDLNETNIKRFQILVNHLYSKGLDTLEGKNKYHDLPFDREKMMTLDGQQKWEECWDYIQQVAFELRLFVKDYNKEPRCFNFMGISRYAYDYFINKNNAKEILNNLINEYVNSTDDCVFDDTYNLCNKLWLNNAETCGFNYLDDYVYLYYKKLLKYRDAEKLNINLNKFKEEILPFVESGYVLAGMTDLEKHAKPISYGGQETTCKENLLLNLLQSMHVERELQWHEDNYNSIDEEFYDSAAELMIL